DFTSRPWPTPPCHPPALYTNTLAPARPSPTDHTGSANGTVTVPQKPQHQCVGVLLAGAVLKFAQLCKIWAARVVSSKDKLTEAVDGRVLIGRRMVSSTAAHTHKPPTYDKRRCVSRFDGGMGGQHIAGNWKHNAPLRFKSRTFRN
ncbi:hypothetical protein OOU_Y34scaffold00042g1, partial [Pyricularia oryzae Y34]